MKRMMIGMFLGLIVLVVAVVGTGCGCLSKCSVQEVRCKAARALTREGYKVEAGKCQMFAFPGSRAFTPMDRLDTAEYSERVQMTIARTCGWDSQEYRAEVSKLMTRCMMGDQEAQEALDVTSCAQQ